MLLSLSIPIMLFISGCEIEERPKVSASSSEETAVIRVGESKNTRVRSIEVLPGHELKIEGDVSNEEKDFIYEVLKTYKNEDRERFENEFFSSEIDPNKISRIAGALFKGEVVDRPDFYLIALKKDDKEIDGVYDIRAEIKFKPKHWGWPNYYNFSLKNENGRLKLHDATLTN